MAGVGEGREHEIAPRRGCSPRWKGIPGMAPGGCLRGTRVSFGDFLRSKPLSFLLDPQVCRYPGFEHCWKPGRQDGFLQRLHFVGLFPAETPGCFLEPSQGVSFPDWSGWGEGLGQRASLLGGRTDSFGVLYPWLTGSHILEAGPFWVGSAVLSRLQPPEYLLGSQYLGSPS